MPAVLFNALAMGALRGFLDTTTPLLVITAAFILVRFGREEEQEGARASRGKYRPWCA